MDQMIVEDMMYLEKVMALFAKNHFNETLELVKSRPTPYIYSRFAYSLIILTKASLTFTKDDFKSAIDCVNENIEILKKSSYKHHLWDKMFKNCYYDCYTCEQVHIDVLSSCLVLFNAFLHLLMNESFSVIVKCGFSMASSYSNIKMIIDCFSKQRQFFQDLLKDTFSYLEFILMALQGGFHLFFASIPPKLVSVFSFIGMKGDLNVGITYLMNVIKSNTIFSPVCGIFLAFYYITATHYHGLTYKIQNNENLCFIRKLLSVNYPDVLLFKYIEVKINSICGEFLKAIDTCLYIINTPMDWPLLSHLFIIELIWCYSCLGEWDKVEKFSLKVSEETNWSKSLFFYIHGCSILMANQPMIAHLKTESLDTLYSMELNNKVKESLNNVSKNMRKILGKHIPDEKFASMRSKSICTDKIVLFPLYEILYIFHKIPNICQNTQCVNRMISELRYALDFLDHFSGFVREKSWCNLILAALLIETTQIDDFESEITQRLNLIISKTKFLRSDLYIVASAACELALFYIKKQDYENALTYVEVAKMDHLHYTLKPRISLRLQAIEYVINENSSVVCTLSRNSSH